MKKVLSLLVALAFVVSTTAFAADAPKKDTAGKAVKVEEKKADDKCAKKDEKKAAPKPEAAPKKADDKAAKKDDKAAKKDEKKATK
ncbi:MAG: hypothetical protein QM472_14540 [Spirochaetota bacterium]|nr:hypothetical protein [Spirochaetota bacterium]OPZ38832.1 MAG: Acid shock protein [Spirochaetes bacterium ADurb.BinA120]